MYGLTDETICNIYHGASPEHQPMAANAGICLGCQLWDSSKCRSAPCEYSANKGIHFKERKGLKGACSSFSALSGYSTGSSLFHVHLVLFLVKLKCGL